MKEAMILFKEAADYGDEDAKLAYGLNVLN